MATQTQIPFIPADFEKLQRHYKVIKGDLILFSHKPNRQNLEYIADDATRMAEIAKEIMSQMEVSA